MNACPRSNLSLFQMFDLLCDSKPTFVIQVTDVIVISPLTCALLRRETLSALHKFRFKNPFVSRREVLISEHPTVDIMTFKLDQSACTFNIHVSVYLSGKQVRPVLPSYSSVNAPS